MMRVLSLLGCVGGAAAHASYMLQASRCARDLSVGANIMGAPAVAGDATIVMMESFPPQVSLQGGFGDVVFEATAGTFAGGNTGCAGSRATTSAGQSVTFNPPDSGVYTIRAVYASSHGAVSVATEMSVGSAASGCPEDLDADGLVNVNDLLSLLSGFGGTDLSVDVNDDGTVDVNDLLQLLSAFGSTDCAAGSSEPAVEAPLWCPSSPPQMCRMMCPEAQACPAGQCNMREGSCCASSCQAFTPPSGGGAAAPCTYGEDCGGQTFTGCGTMCPPTCGMMPGMMCNMMCYNGFQCPNGLFWDENANGVGSGSCVQQDDCSVPMPELPPGVVPGRPFLTAKTVPLFSQAVEQAVSDWVGMVGPDGKHNHDGRPGGDYGQEEEF